MSFHRIRTLADRPYPGRIEIAALAALYGAYELVRGFGSEDWVAARAHTADIVGLERHLHLFVERDVQASCPRFRVCPLLDSSTSSCISRARRLYSPGSPPPPARSRSSARR
jgi:hypothetical protein